MDIQLIATDLDGTLLNDKREISTVNQCALTRAALQGIEIVLATGRHYEGVPEVLRKMPFLRYIIAVNGAQVIENQTGRIMYSAEIPVPDMENLLDYLDMLPVRYESFQDGEIWTPTEHLKKDIITGRKVKAVEHFRERIRLRNLPVPKVQILISDVWLRETVLKELKFRFPELVFTSARKDNIEVNYKKATKGQALSFLCGYLNIEIDSVLALGDGTNDISMLTLAGIGAAMENGVEEVKGKADFVIRSNEDDGFADMVERFVLKQE